MAHWTITLVREGAAIIVRDEGDDPHAPDRIDYDVCGSPGPVYRELLDRIGGGVEVHLLDRMKDERDLSWIAECAHTEALLHPGWSVESDLSLLSEAEEFPGIMPFGNQPLRCPGSGRPDGQSFIGLRECGNVGNSLVDVRSTIPMRVRTS